MPEEETEEHDDGRTVRLRLKVQRKRGTKGKLGIVIPKAMLKATGLDGYPRYFIAIMKKPPGE